MTEQVCHTLKVWHTRAHKKSAPVGCASYNSLFVSALLMASTVFRFLTTLGQFFV